MAEPARHRPPVPGTVLVTGATGTVGRHVVDHLRAAGHPVRALTRDPARARLPADVEVVAGDITDTDTLAPAFAGVRAAHLITFGGAYRPLTNATELVAAAEAAGVERVTLLGGWQESALEPAVRASSLAWTQLRPLEFMGNTLADWGPELRATGAVREPYGDRCSAPVDEYDIGAVAAVALTADGHAGATYQLTGPAVLTPRDKVRILAGATGRALRFEELSPERTRAEWAAAPPDRLLFSVLADAPVAERIEFLLRVYGADDPRGHVVTDDVARVTGRPARTFAEWAARHADRFRP
ncbi:SDR family oxidoreductase [Actinocatenispora rupis]|uniref:Nucleotide-diphosphate-sugar epimerase n=1 Tax=Actinocatenispora rupis TaxID=519421 RepID=A0A8J3IZH0_9ACTN|nr:NAD(P)H-binding protein [Actinocatenispora rupis]GID12896.1 nucleotide-diphosphate-sugar epimerase [Actinocatenispora rupis]